MNSTEVESAVDKFGKLVLEAIPDASPRADGECVDTGQEQGNLPEPKLDAVVESTVDSRLSLRAGGGS